MLERPIPAAQAQWRHIAAQLRPKPLEQNYDLVHCRHGRNVVYVSWSVGFKPRRVAQFTHAMENDATPPPWSGEQLSLLCAHCRRWHYRRTSCRALDTRRPKCRDRGSRRSQPRQYACQHGDTVVGYRSLFEPAHRFLWFERTAASRRSGLLRCLAAAFFWRMRSRPIGPNRKRRALLDRAHCRTACLVGWTACAAPLGL